MAPLISPSCKFANSLARIFIFSRIFIFIPRSDVPANRALVVISFSYAPVSWIWFSSSKPIANMNSWSGFLKLFHKSMWPHHRFLILFDVQVRFGKTLYWLLAISVSAQTPFQAHDILATVLQILTTVSICVDSSMDSDPHFDVSPILTATIFSWWPLCFLTTVLQILIFGML